ncbi:MerR family transcriptional regulator [Deinococcus koreensis]|nr:MerR family transcriptional regulator [Deinococcus koreensis]
MFTASEVEAQTGVPATTLRQWERRYGFPQPVRNASGYRLYSPQDVTKIGQMQAHLRQGVSARRAAELTRGGQLERPTDWNQGGSLQQLSAELTEALLRPETSEAAALLDEAQLHLSPEDMLLSVISPSLVDIGLRWERGEITIAHEHQASSFLRSRLSALMDAEVQGEAGPLVVVACAPGEQHELGLMMVTLALRRRGVRVAFVGADTPLRDLGIYARQRGAAAVALTLQGDWALAPTRAQRPELDDLGLPVFLGGALLNSRPELADELRGIYAGPDAVGAAETIVNGLQDGQLLVARETGT